jgi:hypothetical protein
MFTHTHTHTHKDGVTSQAIVIFADTTTSQLTCRGFSSDFVFLRNIYKSNSAHRRSQWPCGLRRGSTAARLLGLWVRMPPRSWIVSVVCCQVEVSASGWSLVQSSPTDCGVSKKCDCEASKNEATWAPKGLSSHWKKKSAHLKSGLLPSLRMVEQINFAYVIRTADVDRTKIAVLAC